MICFDLMDTPCGPLLVAINRAGLAHVDFVDGLRPLPLRHEWRRDSRALAPFMREFHDYFNGALRTFTLPCAPTGTTFQHEVWAQLRTIPFGQTRSYGELAAQLGKPGASRAVGAANGRNPLSIIVPCHRVIGKDGSLTGYAGGLPIKRTLLHLEGIAI
ncbi:methylated-DNA--[protein]-cysteine S-methyltransferase [Aeromonas simiae]|uniref:methylated-DNA--[protein]-cysteine S-methyltransferase n=1 Tax=Aeromonas simiae TaxID=218936 RepID=UPI0005AB0F91|nr:methylated-DNA--[protein]-cysteine S-methyltransferase [Aeromonas simiae]